MLFIWIIKEDEIKKKLGWVWRNFFLNILAKYDPKTYSSWKWKWKWSSIVGWLAYFNYFVRHPLLLIKGWGWDCDWDWDWDWKREWERKSRRNTQNKSVGLCTHFDRALSYGNHTHHLLALLYPHVSWMKWIQEEKKCQLTALKPLRYRSVQSINRGMISYVL